MHKWQRMHQQQHPHDNEPTSAASLSSSLSMTVYRSECTKLLMLQQEQQRKMNERSPDDFDFGTDMDERMNVHTLT